MDPAISAFHRSIQNISRDPNSLVKKILDSELPKAATRIASNKTRNPTDDCLIADSGDIITYLLEVLSEVAGVVETRYIPAYLQRKTSNWEEEDDLIDLDDANHLDTRHLAFKEICKQLRATATHISGYWEATVLSSIPDVALVEPDAHNPLKDQNYPEQVFEPGFPQQGRHTVPAPTQNPAAEAPNRQIIQDRYPHNKSSSDLLNGAISDGYNDDRDDLGRRYETDINIMQLDTENNSQVSTSPSAISPPFNSHGLEKRGIGNYECPHGLSCLKGGVVDGNVRIFKRNSEFRLHLQKHNKLFKCDLPGCPSKNGFARLDGLMRHKQTVAHNI